MIGDDRNQRRTPEVGATRRKGDQFGHFLFGGSDFVILFQDKDVVLEADVGQKYLHGERAEGE